MILASTKPCPHCQQLRHRLTALPAEAPSQRAETSLLQEHLAAANKHSSTSPKPPSSDIVKPPPPPSTHGGKRPPGGQPGHSQHLRPLLPPEQLTEGSHDHLIEICPC